MKKNEQGSALVIVIFAMVMLLLLTVTLSASVMANYKMKRTELATEQKLYVNDSCISYTQAMIDKAVNDSLISALQTGLTTIRTEEEPEDEYLERVIYNAKESYRLEILAEESDFSDDLEDNMDTIAAHYITANSDLESISPSIKSGTGLKAETCTITYNVKFAGKTQIFTATYKWDVDSVIESICEKAVTDLDNTIDPSTIYIPIETIYG